MRFALCYSVISEIEDYRTNKRTIHIEKARKYWKKFLQSLQNALGFSGYWDEDSPSGHGIPEFAMNDEMLLIRNRKRNQRFFPQVHKLINSFSWFRLEPETESIIFAFDGLRSKNLLKKCFEHLLQSEKE